MIVAKLRITTASSMSLSCMVSELVFSDMEKAETAYKLLAGFVEKNERTNGARAAIEIEAADCRETFIASDIKSVAIQDLAQAEKEASETDGKYPTLMPPKKRRAFKTAE